MASRTLAIIALLAATAAAGVLDARLARADRAAARALNRLAREADRAGQRATAVRLWRRVIGIRPDDATARARLGYRRRSGEWKRQDGDVRDRRARDDADPDAWPRWRGRADAVETERADAVLEACRAAGMPDACRGTLKALLARVPRHAGVHEAIGHTRIGSVHVRPVFEEAVRGLKARERAWAACLDPGGMVVQEAEGVRLEGLDRPLPRLRTGESIAVIGYGDEVEAVRLARTFPASYRLFRRLFGDLEPWRPPALVFLRAPDFERLLDARLDPEQRARYRGRTHVVFPDLYATQLEDRMHEQDQHAHKVVHYSLETHVRPEGARSWERGIWLKEGAGYLATLALFGTARTHLSSLQSSTARKFARDLPPGSRTPAACHVFVRDHLRDGTAYPLREVCGRSLNTLDLLASLQAWAFVRFLAHLDPAGLKQLPAALKAAKAPGAAGRADEALQAAFGRDLAALERLWRAWMLEVG